MKKQAIYLFLTCILFSVVSCKKDSSSSSNNSGFTGAVKSISESVTSTTIGSSYKKINFSYDAQGRVVSMTDSANAGNKQLYSYPSSNKYAMDIYAANKLQIHFICDFDNNYRILNTYQYNDTKDTTWDTYKYTFNSKNQVITSTDFQKFGSQDSMTTMTNFTYDANGNVSKETDGQGGTTSYTYYTNSFTAPANVFPSKPFNGNLIKSKTTVNGSFTATANYTYTFDSMNRVSTSKVVSNLDNSTSLTVYTYY